ncbi:DUF4124 domain-containing protein [Halomonas salifodinae]|uniref:DUF4124 domain-containing protein n=1 Tax=Halomonas salifodinae TaxID=438745 RepID=UPI0033B6F24B
MKWLIILMLLLVPPMAQAVNRCEIDGRTVYQNQPCPPQAEQRALEGQVSSMAGGTGGSAAASSSSAADQRIMRQRLQAEQHRRTANRAHQQQVEREEAQREARRQAQRSGIVAQGMSERDAVRMYGRPDRTNVSQSGSGTCRHLHWSNPRRSVMVCDGEVRSSYAQGVR